MSEIKVSAELVSPEAVREGTVPGLSLQLGDVVFSLCPPCLHSGHVRIQIPLLIRTVTLDQGPPP